jgi:RNA recognition motif-containing protein
MNAAKIINNALAGTTDVPKSVRVGNLPRNQVDIVADLRLIFSVFGRVRDVYVPLANDGKPVGYGFIEFINPSDAIRSVAFYSAGFSLGNRRVSVQLAEGQRKTPSVMSARSEPMTLYDRVKAILQSETEMIMS